MDFEWDEQKSLTNEQRHGIDFKEASKLFDGRPVVISASPRRGELRWMAIGEYSEKVWSVVFTFRQETSESYPPGRPRKMKRKGTIVRYSAEEIDEMIRTGQTNTDWDRLDKMTEEEIERNGLEDNRRHGIPDDWYEDAVLVRWPPNGLVSILLDEDVLEYFRSRGKGYQRRMNDVLRGVYGGGEGSGLSAAHRHPGGGQTAGEDGLDGRVHGCEHQTADGRRQNLNSDLGVQTCRPAGLVTPHEPFLAQAAG